MLVYTCNLSSLDLGNGDGEINRLPEHAAGHHLLAYDPPVSEDVLLVTDVMFF